MKKEKQEKPIDLNTTAKNTWCPGCFNFQILAGVKNIIALEMSSSGKKFAIVSGIGCHAKIFDYINLPGMNSLHGRVIPTCLGMKIGNPNLTVLGFSGDGDAYAEGLEHLIHAPRYNSDFKYIVHNNQVFALTTGQPSPVTERYYKDKTNPSGNKFKPLNPIKLMLAAGASFVARVFADVKQVEWILQEALKHKGFCFIEILQPCIIFHPDAGLKEKTYSLQETGHNKSDFQEAMKKALEFDYDNLSPNTKVPLGIFYQKDSIALEDITPQLYALKRQGKSWKDLDR